MDAFISHASKDVALAEQIETHLRKEGLQAWLDRSDIHLGVLLRKELEKAIQGSRVLVLLWSRAAARSRWVAAEVLTAFHRQRFIVPCVRDSTPLPYFLQNAVYLNLQRRKADWAQRLSHAIRESPTTANDVPATIHSRSQTLQETIQRIYQGQREILDRLGGEDLREAQEKQRLIHGITMDAKKAWPLDLMVLSLVGYHYKNAYQLKHWPAIQAGRPPKDRLLERAERFFFEALFVNPRDYSALNGLGSILIFERELEAAEFFIRRAIALAKQDGIDYGAAKHDLSTILPFKQRGHDRGNRR